MPDQRPNVLSETAATDRELSADASDVAFEMASARLDRQATRIAEIRTNGSVLVAAMGLIASFLGKASLDRSGLSAANWVALVLLVAGVVATSSGTSPPTSPG